MTKPRNQTEQRQVRRAMRLGWQKRCPNCGSGPIMTSFLSLKEQCPACRENLDKHQVGRFALIATVLIVFPIIGSVIYGIAVKLRPDPLTLFSVFVVGCVALSLYLLPRLKGAFVAYQWAKRLPDFCESTKKAPKEVGSDEHR